MILFYIPGITNTRLGLIKVICVFLFQLFVRHPSVEHMLSTSSYMSLAARSGFASDTIDHLIPSGPYP